MPRKPAAAPVKTKREEVVADDDPDDYFSEDDSPRTLSRRNSKSSQMSSLSVTQEEMASLGLLHSPEVLDAVFKGIPMGVVLLEWRGLVSAWSAGAERVFLYKGWEVLGENVAMLMPESVGMRHDYYLSRCRTRLETNVSQLYNDWQNDSAESFMPGRPQTKLMLNDLVYMPDDVQDFAKAAVSKQLLFGGAPREVAALSKSGESLPLEVRVFPLLCKGVLFYLGFISDLRGVSEFQQLTVRQEKLLSTLLDERTMSRVLKGERRIYDRYESASVMFSDIVGYQSKMELLTEEQLIELTRDIFGLCDKVVQDNRGVEKIKTIGDCYMMSAGCPHPVENHQRIIITAGREMLRALNLYNTRVAAGKNVNTLLGDHAIDDSSSSDDEDEQEAEGTEWRRKVCPVLTCTGTHAGPLLGGVMSQLKGFYDILGDTVNYASRLTYAAPPGAILLSTDIYKCLDPELQKECEIKGGIELKGVGRVSAYVLYT